MQCDHTPGISCEIRGVMACGEQFMIAHRRALADKGRPTDSKLARRIPDPPRYEVATPGYRPGRSHERQ